MTRADRDWQTPTSKIFYRGDGIPKCEPAPMRAVQMSSEHLNVRVVVGGFCDTARCLAGSIVREICRDSAVRMFSADP